MSERQLLTLEGFFREYVEAVDGVWDEVEPQVYDALLPAGVVRQLGMEEGREVLRVAFEPEAMPEHPGAQLLSYGSPLLDRIFAHARQQSRVGRIFLGGISPAVHGLEQKVKGGLVVPEGCVWKVQDGRLLFFGHAAFWFQATFSSDEKEQENYLNVVDLFYGRFARHLEEMLRGGELPHGPTGERPYPWPDAPRRPLAEVYMAARERVVRTAAAVAHTHRIEQQQRLEEQVERMQRYYRDLAGEMKERLERLRKDRRVRPETVRSLEERFQGVGQEERLRIAELRQKAALSMHLRLLNLLLIFYPKCRIRARLQPKKGQVLELSLVWDPLVGQLEPLACPRCGRPTRELAQGARDVFGCPGCVEAAPGHAQPGR